MIAVASGLITEAKPLLTKNGERMCFLKISDYGGSLETVVFPRTFTANKDLLTLDNCVAIKGKVSKRNGGLSLIAEESYTEVMKAMQDLTDDQREVLLLIYVHEQTTPEVARILDKSEDTIRQLKSRALKQLRLTLPQ
jgi:DNA polymerase-3 subunit alpha